MAIYRILFILAIATLNSCTAPNAEQSKSDATSNNQPDVALTDHEELYERARKYYQDGVYEKALTDIEQALEQDTFNIQYTHLLADIKLNYYRSKQALAVLRQLIRHRPDDISSKLKLAEFLIILKQNDEAVATINEAIQLDAQNAEAYFLLGLLFREEKDEVRALNSLQRAVELDADQTDAWIILGQIYEQKNDPVAKQYYENAVNSAPDNIIALHSLAFYLQNRDDIPKAISLYDQIIDITDDYQDAHLNRSILLMQIDSFQAAYDGFDRFATAVPESAIPYYYQGYIHELSEDLAAAKNKYERALELDPDYAKAKDALGRITEDL